MFKTFASWPTKTKILVGSTFVLGVVFIILTVINIIL